MSFSTGFIYMYYLYEEYLYIHANGLMGVCIVYLYVHTHTFLLFAQADFPCSPPFIFFSYPEFLKSALL